MKHLFISDTQVTPGVDTDHLEALGNYIVEQRPEVVIHIGDHWDMEALSSFDRPGSKSLEGRRYLLDIEAGNDAMDRLLGPVRALQAQQRAGKRKVYRPRLVFCMGNHEYRINRATESDARLDGVMSTDHFALDGWEVHPFLEIVNIDGINYSHYFINPVGLSGRPMGGSMDNKLNKLGCSFAMGHQQTFQHGTKFMADGSEIQGLVSGAFYSHDEDYLGPQGNRQYWRGVVMCNNVDNGTYDIQRVSLASLIKGYL
jgi:hypothetical protein